MNNIEKIREYFSADLFAAKVTGAYIEDAGKNYARCSLQLRREHKNALGDVMGGVLFTLADFTFAVAANIDNPPTVSVSGQITYLGRAKGESLISEARCLHSGRSGCAFTIDINDNLGNKAASVTIYGFRKEGNPLVTNQ